MGRHGKRKHRWDVELFIRTWNEADSVREVGLTLGITTAAAQGRAQALRKDGYAVRFMDRHSIGKGVMGPDPTVESLRLDPEEVRGLVMAFRNRNVEESTNEDLHACAGAI